MYILVFKIPEFGQKLPNRNLHHTFLESRDPDDTKNTCYVFCSPSGVEKPNFQCQAHGLNMVETIKNLCSQTFLQDLFARFLPQNGTKGYKKISYV